MTCILSIIVAVVLATSSCDGRQASASGAVEGTQVSQAEEAGVPIAFDKKPAVGTKAKCPVMGGEFKVNEDTEWSKYDGKYYVFCCAGCKPQFDEDPEKFLKK